MQGHEVVGLSLEPVPGSLFARGVGPVAESIIGDVRDVSEVREAVLRCRPDVVMHLAAQPLVRLSYSMPRETIETNVMGTLTVLQAVRDCESVQAALIVTTDKVYRNPGPHPPFSEEDPLGGDDPYSASKAMADLLTHSWRSSFPSTRIASARAGNVIGGGDVSEDRLFPDLIRAFSRGSPAMVRRPLSARPWQHVLDCISGYMTLVEAMLNGELDAEGAWNFGPKDTDIRTVKDLADLAVAQWGSPATWMHVDDGGPRESVVLALDSSKALRQLQWESRLSFTEAVRWTVEWHKRVIAGDSPRSVTRDQISEFLRLPR